MKNPRIVRNRKRRNDYDPDYTITVSWENEDPCYWSKRLQHAKQGWKISVGPCEFSEAMVRALLWGK